MSRKRERAAQPCASERGNKKYLLSWEKAAQASASGNGNAVMCYVKEAGKLCQFQADTECERCHKPICDVHTRFIQGFFIDRDIPYCPSCEEKHYREREEY